MRRIRSRGLDPRKQRWDAACCPSKYFGCWISLRTWACRFPPHSSVRTVRMSRYCMLATYPLKTFYPFSLRRLSSNWCDWWYHPWWVRDHRRLSWGPSDSTGTRITYSLRYSFLESVSKNCQAGRQLHQILPLSSSPNHLRLVHLQSDFLWSFNHDYLEQQMDWLFSCLLNFRTWSCWKNQFQ